MPVRQNLSINQKGKGFPYSLVVTERWAWSWSLCTGNQRSGTISHPPGSRLPLLSARPAVTFPAAERHRPLVGTKLYCLVTEEHRCERLAQGCYAGFAPSRNWTPDAATWRTWRKIVQRQMPNLSAEKYALKFLSDRNDISEKNSGRFRTTCFVSCHF